MELPRLSKLSEAIDKNTQPLLDVLQDAEIKMKNIGDAIKSVQEITSELPRLFKQHLHAGNVHNLENPKEYALAISIDNMKTLYDLNKAYRSIRDEVTYLKGKLKAYK